MHAVAAKAELAMAVNYIHKMFIKINTCSNMAKLEVLIRELCTVD
jgi:hypothetical protein